MAPAVVTWATPPWASATYTLPSGPAVMARGWREPLKEFTERANSVTVPAVVMRPTLLALSSVNHRLPSDPAVMALVTNTSGAEPGVDRENSVTDPAVEIRPMPPLADSVNHRLPSGR